MNGFTREDYFVCSKIPPAFQTYDRAVRCIKAGVKAVDQIYLDCMLLLWPGHFKPGGGTDPKDPKQVEARHQVWKALED